MKFKSLSSLILISYISPAFSATDIQFWHGLSGQAAEVIGNLATEFNKSQNEYKVTAIRKGNYQETMIAGIAAYRSKKQPDIIQIYEVGTATMINAKGATIPISKLMTDHKFEFDAKDIILPVRSYYSSGDQLLSFPFNSSAPIMYYNKKLFKKAGLDVNKPPKTWDELFVYAEKIKKSNPKNCGFTTTWPAWIQLENFSAWHNVSYASQSNGMEGNSPSLKFNSQTQIKHWENIQKAYKDGYFTYFGRTTEAELSFTTEKCAIILDSTGSYGKVKEANIDFAVSQLPYYDKVTGAPQNTIIGGASLWVFNGIDKEKQKGAAKFILFLSRPEIMAKWHQQSGYLPVTQASYDHSKKQGFYEKNPGFTIAISELTNKAPTENSKGLRIIGLPNIRNIVEANFESMLSGKMTAQKALDDAVEKGNDIIKKAGR
ncbi:sn-glycerol-3-phosphate ABC transporter substrate-binding protein UgpB [Fluviispira vulneris]|uniref:sn-glycerol-3-phosphate ABC transporter substrate-binding protein UgpB n=1 Tax=Fluviispira vulneris TaxID=2763012 RepID=UPI001644D93E|nr:sn-glycerol-3-phosphate ABC transporter substrate-binding protein UgpB [Fluviispira vulneris]